MAENLVIVESPAKARTLARILGRGYSVKASLGHIRDLPRKTLGVEIDEGFAPKYLLIPEKRKVVKELKEAAHEATRIYLATDPDREGEAIAWHLAEATGLDGRSLRRVVFHEITEEAVKEAFRHPRDIDMHLVDAQQARRVLDRLVGYKLSPLLWSKVRRGLSAGRVQSAALRMVVEREQEIRAFVPREFWRLEAELAKEPALSLSKGAVPKDAPASFKALFYGLVGSKKPLEVKNGVQAEGLRQELDAAAYSVEKVSEKTTHRRPAPPFTTSTLQQEAFRRLRFSAQRTMALAQELYEGIPLGPQGSVGLITYMRTDSFHMASQAVAEAREYIEGHFGKGYLPASPRQFRQKAKGAQEAHEAIRPTSFAREPDTLKPFLGRDQLRLYTIIWQRALASQMADALLDSTAVDITARCRNTPSAYTFRTNGIQVRFPGFLTLYSEGRDEDGEEESPPLPPLARGDALDCLGLEAQQRFTQPPPRYTDASLVKALEEKGIGRPSTYAPILTTLQEREYVLRQSGRLQPTELGETVTELLTGHFPGVVDLGFTAEMEGHLDGVAQGKEGWVPVVEEFYRPFAEALQVARENISKVKLEEPTGETCEKCGKPMMLKMGRFGKFIACSGFPACRNTKPYLNRIGVPCPDCGGDLVERRARAKKGKRGKPFYGCANYPTCNFATNRRPMKQPCPQCGGLLLPSGRGRAQCQKCQVKVDVRELEQEKVPVGVS